MSLPYSIICKFIRSIKSNVNLAGKMITIREKRKPTEVLLRSDNKKIKISAESMVIFVHTCEKCVIAIEQ